jgi:chromosome segregation ATPase
MGAGILSPFKPQASAEPKPEELRREILSVSREHHTLVAELERLRADLERAGSDATGGIEALAQRVRESGTESGAAEKRLAGLEQRFDGLESVQAVTQSRLGALGNTLSEIASKQETRNSQLKFLQDSARGEIKGLKTALAETASRLETRDNQLEELQESTRAAIVALQNNLTETASRLDADDDRFQHVQDSIAEQAQQHAAALSGIAARLDTACNRLGALEEKLEIEYRLSRSQFEEMQMNVRKLEQRFVWMILIVTVVLLLVIGTGIIF